MYQVQVPQPADREARRQTGSHRGPLARAGNGENQLGPDGAGERQGPGTGQSGVPDATAALQSGLCDRVVRKGINVG